METRAIYKESAAEQVSGEFFRTKIRQHLAEICCYVFLNGGYLLISITLYILSLFLNNPRTPLLLLCIFKLELSI